MWSSKEYTQCFWHVVDYKVNQMKKRYGGWFFIPVWIKWKRKWLESTSLFYICFFFSSAQFLTFKENYYSFNHAIIYRVVHLWQFSTYYTELMLVNIFIVTNLLQLRTLWWYSNKTFFIKVQAFSTPASGESQAACNIHSCIQAQPKFPAVQQNFSLKYQSCCDFINIIN